MYDFVSLAMRFSPRGTVHICIGIAVRRPCTSNGVVEYDPIPNRLQNFRHKCCMYDVAASISDFAFQHLVVADSPSGAIDGPFASERGSLHHTMGCYK